MIRFISRAAILLMPCIANADFIYVQTPKTESLPVKQYGAPVEAFQSTSSTVTTVPSIKKTINNIGRPETSLASKRVLPKMEIFSQRLADVLPEIIPNSFTISVYNGVVLNEKIAISFDSGTPWQYAFEEVLSDNDLAATIDWDSKVVTIVNNKREPISTIIDKGLEVANDSDTYVIRKKSDDLLQRQNEGFIIKDGKAIRFDSVPN